MRCLKEVITNNTPIGRMQIIAKALNPAVTSSYIANMNRRKSMITLPPLKLLDVVLSVFIVTHSTILHGCFL